MYNWLVRRVIERTSAPQAVYPAVVDATVRTWMPAVALLAASFVTPARAKVDVRYEIQPPASSWIQTNLPTGPTTAQICPAVQDKGQSFVTAKRANLDVRAYRWDSDFGYDDSQTTAIWTPVNNPVSYQTAKRTPFDIRVHESPIDAGSFATVYSGVLRRYAPASSSELDSFRLRDGIKLDVRSYDWSPEPGWIFTNLPSPITTAQAWPAILAGTQPNYRTAARPSLDVRAYEWRSDAPFMQAATVAVPTWAGVFGGELASFRTGDRPRLDPRTYDWLPEPAWVFPNLPPPATVAQIWPAILENLGTQYRTIERARLDVRRYDWAPAFTWVRPVVDATVAKWAPIFADELASIRVSARKPLDVRIYEWSPSFAWDFQVLPTVFPRIIYVVASRATALSVEASRDNAISKVASKAIAISVTASRT